MKNELILENMPVVDATGNVTGETTPVRSLTFVSRAPHGQTLTENYVAPTFREFVTVCGFLSKNVAAMTDVDGQKVNFEGIITAANGGLVPSKLIQDLTEGLQDIKVAAMGLSNYGPDRKRYASDNGLY